MSQKDDLFVYTDIEGDGAVVPHDFDDSADDAHVVVTTPIMPDDEFAAPETTPTVVEPSFSGTADALTSIGKVHRAPADPDTIDDGAAVADADPNPDVEAQTDAQTDAAPADEAAPAASANPFMRFLSNLVPHIGDSTFEIVRKCIMLLGILVFIGATTYLIDDLLLVPMQNDVLVETLQQMYDPDIELTLTEEEQNYNYPADMDPAFKKLYYQNNDIRGWLSYKTTDGVTFSIDYPIVQSADNDYYLYHDFNRTYNKNGTLFYDYRNDLNSKNAKNRNTLVYGHNMASGQMLAGLNKLLWGVGYARLAPTFTMNTLYEKAEYKVCAVMLVNNSVVDGVPFGYLRTQFTDNVDFAGFMSEVQARSLYVYGDVDIRPDDEVVMLSTCTDWDLAHFKDGRTVVVGRKVRKGETTETDVSKIVPNEDVLMPYGWYINQNFEPHPYYTNPLYVIQPLDTLMEYLATSTAADGETTTAFTLYEHNGTFGLVPPTTATDANGNIITQANPSAILTVMVESTPVCYAVGANFDFDNTSVVAVYADGKKVPINSKTCAVTGFDSSKEGTCAVTLHYGEFNVKFEVSIIEGYVAPVRPTTTTTVSRNPLTTTRPSNFIAYDPNAKKTTTTTSTVTETTTDTTEQTETTETTTTTTVTEVPATVSDVTDPY